jgi:DDE superfamily endonuclease
MWAFNHELSSGRITVEHVLGMLVRHFGMLWKAIEINMNKVPTVFQVMCKLHNICINRYMEDHPNEADEYIVNKVHSHILENYLVIKMFVKLETTMKIKRRQRKMEK